MYGILDLIWEPTGATTLSPGQAPAIVRNDPYDHTIRVTDGWADLGAETYHSQLRESRLDGPTTDDPAASFAIETDQDGTDLLIALHLDATVTTSLPSSLLWDLQMDNGETLLAGKARVVGDVTRVA
jgi:hypothetical protein